MSLLWSRLGLRAGEVAALALDDLDWRAGDLLIRGKAHRSEPLPLPAGVGAAICVSAAQPSSDYRAGPQRARPREGAAPVVDDRRGCRWSRTTPPKEPGSARCTRTQLRHTAAIAMLRAGTHLTEVGLVMLQRRAFTTAVYAKVDRDGPSPATDDAHDP